MLILQYKDVQFCLVNLKINETKHQVRGLLYRGFLFTQVSSYLHEEYDLALKKCRQLLEEDNQITTIIVKNFDNLTLWSHDPELKIANFKENINTLANKNASHVQTKNLWQSQALKFWEEVSELDLGINSQSQKSTMEIQST